MPGQFDMKTDFPIAGVADLLANRSYKEAQMRAQQQQQLVEGLKGFGAGVQSLVDRRNAMAQALAGAQMFSQTPEGQQMMGTNQVTNTAAGGPVQRGQTAAYDPNTGSVTPNASPVNIQTLATALQGLAPKDLLENRVQQQAARTQREELALKKQLEPQKIAIEGRKATAEEENARMQRLIQGLMANATIKNQGQERTQAAENAAFDANKEILRAGSPLNPFNPVTFAQKKAALNAMTQKTDSILPEVGKTIVHSSGVKIKRTK